MPILASLLASPSPAKVQFSTPDLIRGLQELVSQLGLDLDISRVDVRHHGAKHFPGDVRDLDGGRLLLTISTTVITHIIQSMYGSIITEKTERETTEARPS